MISSPQQVAGRPSKRRTVSDTDQPPPPPPPRRRLYLLASCRAGTKTTRWRTMWRGVKKRAEDHSAVTTESMGRAGGREPATIVSPTPASRRLSEAPCRLSEASSSLPAASQPPPSRLPVETSRPPRTGQWIPAATRSKGNEDNHQLTGGWAGQVRRIGGER